MPKKAVVDQMNQVLGPIQDFNALAVANTEKLIKFQFDAVRKYAEFGIAQMKATAELKTADELPGYQAKSAKLVSTVADAVRADAEAAAELGTACVTDVQTLMQANLERATIKAA